MSNYRIEKSEKKEIDALRHARSMGGASASGARGTARPHIPGRKKVQGHGGDGERWLDVRGYSSVGVWNAGGGIGYGYGEWCEFDRCV